MKARRETESLGRAVISRRSGSRAAVTAGSAWVGAGLGKVPAATQDAAATCPAAKGLLTERFGRGWPWVSKGHFHRRGGDERRLAAAR